MRMDVVVVRRMWCMMYVIDGDYELTEKIWSLFLVAPSEMNRLVWLSFDFHHIMRITFSKIYYSLFIPIQHPNSSSKICTGMWEIWVRWDSCEFATKTGKSDVIKLYYVGKLWPPVCGLSHTILEIHKQKHLSSWNNLIIELEPTSLGSSHIRTICSQAQEQS